MLSEVIADALARRAAAEREHADLVARLRSATSATPGVLAALAHARARVLIEEAAAAQSESRRLRRERNALLAEAKPYRETLRAGVVLFAQALRHAGTPPERALLMVRDALSTPGVEAETTPDALALARASDDWVLEAYRVA
jgi:hypothetical protein